MGRIVIVAFKPKPGKTDALRALVAKHWRILHGEGLVTDREAWIMEAAGGIIIEVFEWKSADAIAQAHTNPVVGEMWVQFGEVCEYVPLARIPEATNLFAEFEGVVLSPDSH